MTLAQLATLPLPSAVADRAALLRAVEITANVVETRNTYPILSNLRLRGDGQTMFVTGTDLDIVVDVVIPAAADAAFDVTLPAQMLKGLLKGAPKGDIVSFTCPDERQEQQPTGRYVTDPANGNYVLDANGLKVSITEEVTIFDGGAVVDFMTAKYTVNPLHPSTWPEFKGPANTAKDFHAFTIAGADLADALASVQFAISNEETRYYLNGVYLHTIAPNGVDRYNGSLGVLRAVATDGHRMARREIAAPVGSLGMPGIILPKKAVALLLKLLKPAKAKTLPDVAVELTDASIRFMFDGVTITSKAVEGTFPDYERVTPKHNDKLATFNVEAMCTAINAVSLMSKAGWGGKAVKLEIDSATCTVSVTNPDSGAAESSFPVEYGFATFEIGFNSTYLMDVVAHAKGDGETVTLAFNDAGSPTVVTGSRDGWLGVLMPMRV